jgi:hypothetical protein
VPLLHAHSAVEQAASNTNRARSSANICTRLNQAPRRAKTQASEQLLSE